MSYKVGSSIFGNSWSLISIDITNKCIFVLSHRVNSLSSNDAQLNRFSEIIAIFCIVKATNADFNSPSNSVCWVFHSNAQQENGRLWAIDLQFFHLSPIRVVYQINSKSCIWMSSCNKAVCHTWAAYSKHYLEWYSYEWKFE